MAEPPRLQVILRKALATFRFRFWRVTVPAVVIFVPLTVVETVAEHAADDHTSDFSLGGELVLALSLAGTSGLLIGWVLYAGLLDSLVAAHHFGRAELPVRKVLRELPYGRLIVADVVVTVLVVVGIVLFVIPGLVVLTLFGIVGPIIVNERPGVLRALGRSARLVRPHIRLAVLLIAVPFLAEQLLEDLIVVVRDGRLWVDILVAIGLNVVVGVAVSLVEVVLAHELMARDRLPARPGAASSLAVRRAL